MGYDVNYNELDYADSKAICQRVYQDLQGIERRLLEAAQQAQRCQDEVNLQCFQADLTARGYTVGVLAEKIRSGYQHSVEATIAGRRLSEAVEMAMENYVDAEVSVQKTMAQKMSVSTIVEFLLSNLQNNNRPPTEQLEAMLRLLMLANPLNGLGLSGSLSEQVENTGRLLSRTVQRLRGDDGSKLRLGDKDPEQLIETDGGLDSYAQLHRLLSDSDGMQDGKLIVARVEDGRYVVVIPGTQEGFGSVNAFDAMGIVDALGQDSENYAEPIAQALEFSGAQEGDAVTMTGYSQGGIHAANLMKNGFLGKNYKLDKLVTFGSPIGNIDIPENVKVLALEDAKDMVPGTDGKPNKYREKQLTVTFDGPRDEIKDSLPSGGIFGSPHALDNYADHLHELQQNPTPRLRDQLRGFELSAGSLIVRRFKLERSPDKKKPTKDPRQSRKHDRLIMPPH